MKSVSTEEQKAITPETVLKNLEEGNYRYAHQDLTAHNHSAMVRDASEGQYPKAGILSCLDKRVPVEDLFD